MKKTYIKPELTAQLINTEGLIALSLQSGHADSSDALVKNDWGDIWGDDTSSDNEDIFED